MQDTLTKPYEQALELADIAIGDKLVTFPLEDGVIQLDDDNDVILTAKTVLSTNYTDGTVTYHSFDLKPIVTPLALLGIPNREMGDEWDSTLCTVSLEHATELVRSKMGTRVSALGTRQLSSLTGPTKPDWEK